MKKVDLKSFETQYKSINLNSLSFVSSEEFKAKEKQQLSGKNQSIWRDIVKRFFKNKWNILFTLLLLVIVAMVIIVPLASKYSATNSISDVDTNSIRYTKPSWITDWNHITRTYTPQDLNDIISSPSGDSIFKADDIVSQEEVKNTLDQIVGYRVTFINRLAPSTILGTDSTGVDVFTKLFVGARWSLALAILVATIETIIGTVIGIYLGYHLGSKIDTISMRIIEIFRSVPGLIWLLIFTLILGTSFFAMVLALIIVGWTAPVYIARMFTIKVKDSEFIKAAESIGVSKSGRLFKHVLPNILGRLLVSFVHRIPAVIFMETTLVFLGIKVGDAGGVSIGNIISEAKNLDALSLNIWYALSATTFLLLFSISLQIIANGIRDAFDPKTGGR